MVETWTILTSRNFFQISCFSYSFDKLFLQYYNQSAYDHTFLWGNALSRRNREIIDNRCCITYPNDTYKYETKPSHLITEYSLYQSGYRDNVWTFLWKQIKNSDSCCCKSKFFCSSSQNLEKCVNGCCKKCEEIFDTESDTSITDNDTSSSSESDRDSFNEF